MSDGTNLPPEPRKAQALRRAEQLSRSLAETARRFRLSKRSRRASGLGGFRMRRHARLFKVLYIVGFVLIVLIPTIVGGAYFGMIASPQYIAEAKFAVRTGEIPKVDGLGSLTGLPAAKIAQDTQVITNYMRSRPLVEALDQRLGLRGLYSADSIDWYARFGREKSIEKFIDYWHSMADTTIQVPSGIVTLTVRAFDPHDAKRIAEAVMELSEVLVNDMNERMLRATLADAEREFVRAADRLSRARAEFQKVRNAEGTLDAGEAGKALADLVTVLKGERLRLQQEYQTQSRYVSSSAPQMRTLGARISALADQIADLESKLTSQPASASVNRVLSESLTKFAQHDLERRIAERQYTAAATSLEVARIASQRQLVYLAAFVRPALPEESRYPRRVLYSVGIALASLSAWGLLCFAAAAVRNHMA